MKPEISGMNVFLILSFTEKKNHEGLDIYRYLLFDELLCQQ